ncbi:tetratricopeptide repeat protein [Hymenobacter cellulosilyticus]|uniref:Tol-pal system protein YbgF n=1 Tax=Hymenobacter cellulosilyticus TaxID=2932248 RepID=A0A8T9Q0Z4_9BACT|nr:tol-pal system protein YbgF [Hymenobacter cellulosilyticus]UOQ71124.1 tol-pal system protein YbgF [Hymenobacter cellulosilyticus]
MVDFTQLITKILRLCIVLALLPVVVRAQSLDTALTQRTIRLEDVEIAPTAINTNGWLLLDQDIKTELDGGVENLYNFKFDRAEKQFRSLRRRYRQHPLPYFLLGLSQWWKIMPTNITEKSVDKLFFAYMDTAATKAEALYEQDNQNYEASFFLAASYSFSARLHAERHNWTQATVAAKRSLKYLELSKQANGLSPEFLFGQALFNYYAVWIADEFRWLRPVLLFFPKGNTQLGLQQLRNVAANAVYTGPEAKFFLLKILSSERENQPAEALQMARKLATTYPDNPYFQRQYAMQCFNNGYFAECEKVSSSILDKHNRGLTGYDSFSGRYASYFLGYIQQMKYKSLATAKDYYQRCLVFSEVTNQTEGYYLYATLNLGRIAQKQNDAAAAQRYFKVLAAKSDRKSALYKEAQDYLKARKKSARPAKGTVLAAGQ